jgi:secondary thiamine-phosphate synthase enzyme
LITELSLRSQKRTELIDVTAQIEKALPKSGSGFCRFFVPHTTAGVLINENADPSVAVDISEYLSKLIPHRQEWKHLEGNADAHVKAALVGTTTGLPYADGKLLLGRWQGVFFCEFDGPRTRRLILHVSPDE